jgi:hypothetical protein
MIKLGSYVYAGNKEPNFNVERTEKYMQKHKELTHFFTSHKIGLFGAQGFAEIIMCCKYKTYPFRYKTSGIPKDYGLWIQDYEEMKITVDDFVEIISRENFPEKVMEIFQNTTFRAAKESHYIREAVKEFINL